MMNHDHTPEQRQDPEFVDELAIVMRKVAPEIPFAIATQRLEQASRKLDKLSLYTMAYFIVTGQVLP